MEAINALSDVIPKLAEAITPDGYVSLAEAVIVGCEAVSNLTA